MQRKLCLATLLFFSAGAYAANETCNTNEDVKQADLQWQNQLSTQSAERMAALYETNAVLLATFENNPITTPEGRLQYFQDLFGSMKSLHVVFDKEILQVFPGGAVSSGLYTFKGMKEGKPTAVAARYTFVYEATPQGCQLIEHHSSVLPKH